MADTAAWRTLAEEALNNLEAEDDTRPFGWSDEGAGELAVALLAACTQLEQPEGHWAGIAKRATERAEAAEKERDDLSVERDTFKQVAERHGTHLKAADARLAETQKALRSADNSLMHAEGWFDRNGHEGLADVMRLGREDARAALTTHPAEKQ